MKTWSYKAITEKVEHEINSLMKQRSTSESDFERRMFQGWAYGVFLGWKNLTIGWMKDGDVERLESLTEIMVEIKKSA